MNIIGPDALVFGVDDLAACGQYLIDYGLKDVGEGRYEALDGTAVVLRAKDDPSLPPGLGTASLLRYLQQGGVTVLEVTAADKCDRRGESGPCSLCGDPHCDTQDT